MVNGYWMSKINKEPLHGQTEIITKVIGKMVFMMEKAR